MKDKTCLVAFLDILGFKKLIDDHFSGKNKDSLTLLKKAMRDAKEYAIKYSKGYLKQFEIKFSVKQFSDCISISMPLKQKQNHTTLTIYGIFINVVRLYQLILLENNILVRGGISIGGHFENSNMIFSDGLVKSYKLETQKAIYPRILIGKDVLTLIEDILKKTPGEFDNWYDLYGSSIIKDWDDEVFISPFGFANELVLMANKYGEEELKNILKIYMTANQMKGDIPDDLMERLIASDKDKETMKGLLTNINSFLRKNPSEKSETLVKYKWLKQFIIWSTTPKKSKIKFEHYFAQKRPLVLKAVSYS